MKKRKYPNLQVPLDKKIVAAIKLMAAYKKMTMQDYLNNFFKNFLLHEAQVINNEFLVQEMKKYLQSVNLVNEPE